MAARNGLREQVLRNEQLKLRLARLLHERFGASSEKLRSEIEQLDLLLGELEEQVAEATPDEPDEPVGSETQPSPPGTQAAARDICHAMWWSMPRRARGRVEVACCARWAKR